MRIVACSIIVSIGLVCGTSSSVSAQSTEAAMSSARAQNHKVSGSFQGTHFYELMANGCLIYDEFHLTYLTKGGRSGSLTLSGCVIGPDGQFSFSYRGSFALAARNGATLSGSVTGDIRPVSTGETLSLTLHIEDGTKQFSNLTGDIDVASTDFFPETTELTGTLDPLLVR